MRIGQEGYVCSVRVGSEEQVEVSKSVKKVTCSTCTMFVSVLVMVSGVLLVMCCFYELILK